MWCLCVCAFVGQMKPKSRRHWASWVIPVRGREERLKGRSQYRRWLWTWWNSIYIGSNKEGLPIRRVLPWPNSQLSFVMNPRRIRNGWCYSKCCVFWWKGINWLWFYVAILIFIWVPNANTSPWLFMNQSARVDFSYLIFFWMHILAGIYWCWEGFDRERNSNGQINLWRCWFW